MTSPRAGNESLEVLRRFRHAARLRARRRVTSLSPAQSAEWIYGADAIAHRSGGFFRVVGLSYPESPGSGRLQSQLIIDQPEVGVLGLAVCAAPEGPRCLVQLKCEPGNVGSVQLAPTCQATQSNLARMHGGSHPPGSFLLEQRPWTESLQSEQGTRFWQKRNRNIVWRVGADQSVPPPERTSVVWTSAAVLRQALAEDYLVNTDLRSVLATSDWEAWLGPEPFARGDQDALTQALARAWGSQSNSEIRDRGECILGWLAKRRADAAEWGADTQPLPLEAVSPAREAPFVVRHVRVVIRERERECWDQPLVTSRSPGEVALLGYRQHGVLRFLFQASWEPGLHDHVELHPSLCLPPGSAGSEATTGMRRLCASGVQRRRVWQSDEGGRFWRDCSVYRVIEVADPGEVPESFVALTPREVMWLAPRGVFTNEARSSISLLLSTAAVL